MRGRILVGLIVSTMHAPIQAATFTALGDLPGGGFESHGLGLSGDGKSAVGRGHGFAGTQAFRWANGLMTGLGDLPGGAFFSRAHSISGDGAVIAGCGVSGIGGEAFRWTSASGMTPLGHLSADRRDSCAYGISADGSKIVGISAANPEYDQAFSWTASTGMIGLGYLPGGLWSDARAVSADGSVIVGVGGSASGTEAFRWTAGGGMVGLGDLAGGNVFSMARAVSADGKTVVGSSTTADGEEAFRWTEADGMVLINDRPPPYAYSVALGVSADGRTIVGSQYAHALGDEAFVWRPGIGAQRLLDVLLAGGAVGLNNWTLVSAFGVSTDGTTIVGMGTNPQGNPEAFLATIAPIPVPTAAWLLGGALAALFEIRRRAIRS